MGQPAFGQPFGQLHESVLRVGFTGQFYGLVSQVGFIGCRLTSPKTPLKMPLKTQSVQGAIQVLSYGWT